MNGALFEEIERVFPHITGWCSLQRAEELAAMILALRPHHSVCVGVWGGKETIPMAMAHRSIGIGKVLAIDPWAAAASVQGQDDANLAWWNDQKKHDDVYEMFMSKVRECGLQDWIEVHRKCSDDVVAPQSVGVAVIDGNHGPQAVEDVRRFAPSIPVGGFLYLDDLKWSGGHVEKAETMALMIGFRRLHSRDTGAFYQRIR